MTRPPARAYSYLRFSTPEQAKGDSLRRQTALAAEYAQRQGLTLDTELNMKDLGVSAYRGDNRAVGALGGFLKAVSDGLVERGSYLLVESLDRVSRQAARKAVRTLEDLVESGIVVVTLTDGKAYTEESLDGGTEFLMAILLFMRANEESLTKSKRVKATWVAKRERAARGEVQTVRAPGWLRAEGSGAKESRNAKFTVIPERAKVIRRVFDMFLAGQGKRGIAETFNREHLRPWGSAKHWYSNYVFRCLTNPAVTGVYAPHVHEHAGGRLHRVPQTPIPGYFPRVINDETFQRAQTLIKGRSNPVRKGRIASLVGGLARCPACGATMTRVVKGHHGAPRLLCVTAKAGAGCKFHSVRLPDVERAFIENAAALRRPPMEESTLAEEIEGADEELYRVTKQVETLVSAIERGPSAALSKRLAEREAQAAKLKGELEQLRARASESESRVVKLRATRLADALANLKPETLAAANTAMRECLTSIVVDYVEGVLKLQWRHGPRTELRYGAGTQWTNLDAEEPKPAPRGRPARSAAR